MPDDVREYLRAAQQAEVRGDKPRAVELLEKAARLYTADGNPTRALSLLRHARRLDGGTRADLNDEVKRLEWLPDDPLSRAMAEPQLTAMEDAVALAPLDAFLEGALPQPKALVERGPQVAAPGADAWCSFCCRPKAEVGELVAGPAGAFVCAGCIAEAGRLLQGQPRAGADSSPRTTAAGVGEEAAGGGTTSDAGRGGERSTASHNAREKGAHPPAAGADGSAVESSRLAGDAERSAGADGSAAERSRSTGDAERSASADGSPAEVSRSTGEPRVDGSAVDRSRSTGGEGEAVSAVEGSGAGSEGRAGADGSPREVSWANGRQGPRSDAGSSSSEGDLARALASELGLAPASSPLAEDALTRLVAPTLEERPAPPVQLVGQAAALALLDPALQRSVPRMAVFGPPGCGKSTYLRELARRGFGRYLVASELTRIPLSPEGQRLLLDGWEGAAPELRERLLQGLVSPSAPPFLMAFRAKPLTPALVAVNDALELPLYPTRGLVEACEGRLPESLALRLQAVACFQAPVEAELEEVARRLLLPRASELDLSEDLLRALAAEAFRSPLSGHELSALLLRLPPGSWQVKPPVAAPSAPPPVTRKKRRGKASS